MNNECRVYREELENDLQQDAGRSQLNAEMFEDLDMQYCKACESNRPAEEMSYEHPDICAECWNDGEMDGPDRFIDAHNHVHHV